MEKRLLCDTLIGDVMAKMWIARDCEGLTAFKYKPERYYLNPWDDNDFIWITNTPVSIELDPNLFPEVTIGNSPKLFEIEL